MRLVAARDLLRRAAGELLAACTDGSVEGGGRYAVDVSYRTSGIQNDAGLSWQVVPLLPAQTLQGLPIAAAENPTWSHFQFVAPSGCRGCNSRSRTTEPWNDRIEGYVVLRRSALAKNGLIIARRLRLSGDEAEKQEEEEKRQSEDQDFAQELFPPDTVASRSNLLLAGSLPCRILPGILREVGE